jgi:iron(III) transport system permease protein
LRSSTLAAIALLLALALWVPVLTLAVAGSEGEASGGDGFERRLGLMGRTLGVCVGAAASALALGLPAGLVLAAGRCRGARLLGALLFGLLAVPPHLHAIAWAALAGADGWLPWLGPWLYSVPGAGLVLGFSLAPLAVHAAARGLRQAPASQVEAALLARGRVQALVRVAFPAARPWLAAAAVAVLALAAGNYGVPEHLRVHVYAVEVMARFGAMGDAAGAAAVGMPLSLVSGVLALVVAGLVRRAPAASPGPLPIRGWMDGWAGSVVLAATAGLCGALPLGALMARSGTLESLGDAARVLAPDLPMSVGIAAGAGLAAASAGWLLACASLWGRPRAVGRLAAAACLLALALPESVSAVALTTWIAGHPSFSFFYGSAAGLTLALALRCLPLGWALAAAGLRVVAAGQEESARLAGIGPGRFLARIVAPQSLAPVSAAALAAGALAFADLETALVMTPPGFNPLGVRLFNMVHYGMDGLLAGAIVLVAGAVAAGAAGAAWVTGVNRS